MPSESSGDPRIAALPDSHGHAKGEHKAFAEERPIPYTARMLFLWFFHACRRAAPRFLMVADHINYLTFEDPAAVNLVRRALKLAQAGDLYGAAETAGVELNHAAVVSEGLRRGMRYSIGAEIDNDPRSRPDAQNIVDAMRPDGMIRSVHFLPITHPQYGEWMWPFDNPEFKDLYETVGVEATWELYVETLVDAIEKLPGHIVAHPYVPAKFGHWPDDQALERYEDRILAACSERGMAIEINSRYFYKYYVDDETQLERYKVASVRLMRKAKAKGVMIAVGSDAHSPKDQGRDFDAVLALLDQAEINDIAFPVGGRLARVALRVTEETRRNGLLAGSVQPQPAAPHPAGSHDDAASDDEASEPGEPVLFDAVGATRRQDLGSEDLSDSSSGTTPVLADAAAVGSVDAAAPPKSGARKRSRPKVRPQTSAADEPPTGDQRSGDDALPTAEGAARDAATDAASSVATKAAPAGGATATAATAAATSSEATSAVAPPEAAGVPDVPEAAAVPDAPEAAAIPDAPEASKAEATSSVAVPVANGAGDARGADAHEGVADRGVPRAHGSERKRERAVNRLDQSAAPPSPAIPPRAAGSRPSGAKPVAAKPMAAKRSAASGTGTAPKPKAAGARAKASASKGAVASSTRSGVKKSTKKAAAKHERATAGAAAKKSVKAAPARKTTAATTKRSGATKRTAMKKTAAKKPTAKKKAPKSRR